MGRSAVRPRFARLSVALAVLAASGALCAFLMGRPPVGRVANPPHAGPTVLSAAPGARWGAARNSAHEDGSGFFDREAARQFAAAVSPELRSYVVDLNARALLPVPGEESLAEVFGGDVRAPAVASERRVAYLQFHDHPRDDQRRRLAAEGLELLSYVSGYAWSARGLPQAFQGALSLDFVRAIARVDARDKLHPLAFRGQTPAYARAPDGRARFMLLARPGADPQSLASELARDRALAGVETAPATRSVLGPRFEVVAPVALALRLASLDLVAFLSFVPPPAAPRGSAGTRDATTDNQSNIGVVRDGPPNLSGAGVKVAVREVGRMEAHEDFAARLTYVDNDGAATGSPVNHATAVTGQLGSDGHVQPAAKGVAPGVSLFAYALTNDTFATADVLDAATRGARLSSHSYGPAGLAFWGDYDSISADWDDALRKSDLIGVFAGNEESGGLYKHIDYLVGAKNTLCVTATNASAHAGNDDPYVPRSDGIASFSEFGPMNDGRVKPDLAAFGDNVTLVQGLNGIQTNSGTSFSAPTVSGVAALVFQHYNAVVGQEPSAALAKALLCNSATDLGLPGPDAIYGFGILNAKEAIATIGRRQSAGLTPFVEDLMPNGGTKSFTVTLQGAAQLKVTLCWMDVAGTPAAARALVNDLDLVLEAPGGMTFLPFSLDANNPSAAAASTAANRADPVEQVIVDKPLDGTWTVRVAGTSVPQGPQPYAVCLNQPASPPPLTAVIAASPDIGAAPLTVSFSAAMSTGQPTVYSWAFGDGTTAEAAGLVTVDHTYAAAGSYTVTLTLDGAAGATHVVQVTKRKVDAVAVKARASLSFRRDDTAYDDSLQFVIRSSDLMLPAPQARSALRTGEFNGRTFLIKIGGSANGAAPAAKVGEAVLDSHARFMSREVTSRLNPVRGEIQVQLRHLPLEAAFRGVGMTRAPESHGTYELPVEVETPDTIYRAVYRLLYKVHPAIGGTAKSY